MKLISSPFNTLLSISTLLLMTASTAIAADDKTTASQTEGTDSSRPVFFAAQKFWAATWDIPLMDSQVVLPGPVVKTSPRSSQSGIEIVPITTIGAQYKGFSLSSSYFGETKFSSSDDTASSVNRREWDIALGYAILPNLTASIAYRSGTIDEGGTLNTRNLTGTSGGYKINAWLVGLSGSAPLQGPLALYGNFAYGILENKVDGGTVLGSPTYDGTYKIGEVGLSYRILGGQEQPGFFKSLTAQFGYRAQIINVRGFEYPILSVPAGVKISSQKSDVRSTTDGLVVGIVAAF